MSPDPKQPALTESFKDLEKTDDIINSIYNRMKRDLVPRKSTPESDNAIAVTTKALDDIGEIVNSDLPYREQVKQLKGKLGTVAENQISIEELGHSILDGLATVLPDEQERGSMLGGIDAAYAAEPPPRKDEEERLDLMETILDTGLNLPSEESAEDISKSVRNGGHRYFTITEGILRVNTINVDRDIQKIEGKDGDNRLAPFSSEEGRAVQKMFIEKLTALKNVDTINKLGFTPPKPPKGPKTQIDRKFDSSMKLLLIALFAFGAMMSFAIERNRKFPLFTLIYGGVALALARPDLFAGQEQAVARQLNFTIEHPVWKDMMEDPPTKAKISEDFILSMTEDADIRAKSHDVAKNDGDKEKVKAYFEFLRDEGVAEEHVVFLEGLKKNKPEQFSFITAALSQISDEGARTSLVGFAKEGLTIKSLASLKPPAGAVPKLASS